jgi:hypothetical protein
MPTSPVNGGVSVIPMPLQTPLMTVSFTRTTRQGSSRGARALVLVALAAGGTRRAPSSRRQAGRTCRRRPCSRLSRMRSAPPVVVGFAKR